MSDETMVYAARFPGQPGYGAMCVDRQEWIKESAKNIASWMRQGARIERVTLEVARAGMKEFAEAKAQKMQKP